MKWFRPRLWRGRGRASYDEGPAQESFGEVTPEELQEFLEADGLDVGADPAFKERLRKKLWEIVQARARERAMGKD